MNILVVLAVAVVVSAPSLPSGQSAVVGRRLVGGDLRPAPIRIHRPDSPSVISIYMGIVSIAILAYVSSSQERREEVSRPLVRFMTEKRYTRSSSQRSSPSRRSRPRTSTSR